MTSDRAIIAAKKITLIALLLGAGVKLVNMNLSVKIRGFYTYIECYCATNE